MLAKNSFPAAAASVRQFKHVILSDFFSRFLTFSAAAVEVSHLNQSPSRKYAFVVVGNKALSHSSGVCSSSSTVSDAQPVGGQRICCLSLSVPRSCQQLWCQQRISSCCVFWFKNHCVPVWSLVTVMSGQMSDRQLNTFQTYLTWTVTIAAWLCQPFLLFNKHLSFRAAGDTGAGGSLLPRVFRDCFCVTTLNLTRVFVVVVLLCHSTRTLVC